MTSPADQRAPPAAQRGTGNAAKAALSAVAANEQGDPMQQVAQIRIKQLGKQFIGTNGTVTPQMAETARNLHPMRLQYEAFSSSNPFMAVASKTPR